jgi:hypothetical protein
LSHWRVRIEFKKILLLSLWDNNNNKGIKEWEEDNLEFQRDIRMDLMEQDKHPIRSDCGKV